MNGLLITAALVAIFISPMALPAWRRRREQRLEAAKRGGHVWDECSPNCDRAGCWVCEGGLAICVACGCLEGSLPTHCPGIQVPYHVQTLIYKGRVDFYNKQWRSGRTLWQLHAKRLGVTTKQAAWAMARMKGALDRAARWNS